MSQVQNHRPLSTTNYEATSSITCETKISSKPSCLLYGQNQTFKVFSMVKFLDMTNLRISVSLYELAQNFWNPPFKINKKKFSLKKILSNPHQTINST